MLPAFEMLEYSVSCLHISWFGEVRILVNRCSEVAQPVSDPSFLRKQEEVRFPAYVHLYI